MTSFFTASTIIAGTYVDLSQSPKPNITKTVHHVTDRVKLESGTPRQVGTGGKYHIIDMEFENMSYSDLTFFEFLGIDLKKLLAGSREFIYYTQCCAGDTIVYTTRVDNIIEKQGRKGKMDILTAITTGKNKKTNETVFDHINSLIIFH